MMKKIKVITLGIVISIIITTPIFATQPQVPTTPQYVSDTLITDIYGNYVAVDTRWLGSFTHSAMHSDTKNPNYRIVKFTREGYKPGSFTQAFPKEQTIVIEPSKINQVTTGQLIIPENLPKDNWWISFKIPGAHKPDVSLKVKSDGTFKFVNLKNGIYNVEIFNGTHSDVFINDHSRCKWTKTHSLRYNSFEVKGNLNKTIDLSNEVPTEQTPLDAEGKYITNIDYANPDKYLKPTAYLKLDEATKAIIDSKIGDNKDRQTMLNLFELARTVFPKGEPMSNAEPNSARELLNMGKGRNGNDYATVVQAFLMYKGFPTISVDTLDLAWTNEVQAGTGSSKNIRGHIFVEVYLPTDKKWVLIDPTRGYIYDDYIPTEDVIYGWETGAPKHYVASKTTMDGSMNAGDLSYTRSELQKTYKATTTKVIKPTYQLKLNK